MISILHPSKGRPQKAFSSYNNWMSKRNNGIEIEWIVAIDTDDLAYYEYCSVFEGKVKIRTSQHTGAVYAINMIAKEASGDILMVVSDDTDCPEHWDSFLLKWINGKSDFICKVADGIQPWIITMPIMDRVYYNRFGYIYHPDYQHMFCDTELTCVADLTGRKLTSNILFKHNHYSVTKEQPDAVNKKADATWAQGEKLFLERYKRNFDLKPEDIKGKIQDNGMINWLQKKAR